MTSFRDRFCFMTVVAVVAAAFIGMPAFAAGSTPLDKYVQAPDDTYKYSELGTYDEPGIHMVMLQMTSQTWLTAAEVDRPVWQHLMLIIEPETVATNTCILGLGSGNTDDITARKYDFFLNEQVKEWKKLAADTQSIVAIVYNVPNEPLTFTNDPGKPAGAWWWPGEAKRGQDDILAFSFWRVLETQDPNWSVFMPMTKSAVRAMDTVQKVVTKTEVKDFIVTGHSKRGLTSWLAAVVDPRVRAIAPQAIDMVNMPKANDHYRNIFGTWPGYSYAHLNVYSRSNSPEGELLLNAIDPYKFLDRLTMPKLILNGANDQGFPPDSAQYYFPELKGENYIHYFHDAGHEEYHVRKFAILTPWILAQIHGKETPTFSYYFTAATNPKDNKVYDIVTITTPRKPEQVLLRTASSPDRNFRYGKDRPAWSQALLEGGQQDDGSYKYTTHVPHLANAWTEYFVELKFPSEFPQAPQYTFCTEARVAPPATPVAPVANFYLETSGGKTPGEWWKAEAYDKPATAKVNAPIHFLDMTKQGTAVAISYEWDFGDGARSTERDPHHTYTAPGTYTITLTVTSAAGNDTKMRVNHLTVEPEA